MALYGKSALDLFKEIAQCPAEILPAYNVSFQKVRLASKPRNTSNASGFAGRACASCENRDTGAQGSTRYSLLVSFKPSCVFLHNASDTQAANNTAALASQHQWYQRFECCPEQQKKKQRKLV